MAQNYYEVSATSTTATDWIVMDTNNIGHHYSLVLDFTTGSGVGTADVEFCIENSTTGAIAITHDVLTGKTADAASNHTYPVKAFRLNLSAYTSGTVTLKIRQGDK